MSENEIAKAAVDAAFQVHKRLGPGLLESVYEATLAFELKRRGLTVDRQVPIPIVYESIHLDEGFRANLVVEGKVIVELKSIEATIPVHRKQVLTYLRLADKRLGLLINFGAERIGDGITRLVNGLPEDNWLHFAVSAAVLCALCARQVVAVAVVHCAFARNQQSSFENLNHV